MSSIAILLLFCYAALAADVVPTDIMQPGTQLNEVKFLESPDKCDNCHGGYNETVEPAFNWRGTMMANAGRDPIFWATLAVAEQDFNGAGDLCIRCHSPGGWLAGHSTPTDGSGLTAWDSDGVECDFCHKVTNPDNSDPILIGVQNDPFLANDLGDLDADPNNITGYYGTGMYVMWNNPDKLGPYSDATSKHRFIQSRFHRSVDFCGTCHDVSNPAVGDLAHNSGALDPTGVVASGEPGSPVEGKAAFNNFPYEYGIVERTQSEYKAGLLSQTPVSDYDSLPEVLQAGAVKAAYDSAFASGTEGNYADGTVRYFSCQSCHEPPVEGYGANKPRTQLRADLPYHDFTGGNYWVPDAIQYLDGIGQLRLGGGLTRTQNQAIDAGQLRAGKQLENAAVLEVNGNTLKVINTAGHKLITGYPEGRRMWVNVKWYNESNGIVREDGKYGPVQLEIDLDGDGVNDTVNTILNLKDKNTKIYESHPAMTQEWANQLMAQPFNVPGDLPLSYDRFTGEPDYTLGELAAQPEGTTYKTFHFVLNNAMEMDNRIPPYGMSYDEAKLRNALPVPEDQYGNPGSEGVYNYWDEITLNPPDGAVRAEIQLLYQPTSWEYVLFLYKANSGSNPFLAEEGNKLLDAWLNNDMAKPYVMASTTWPASALPPASELVVGDLVTLEVDIKGNPAGQSSTFAPKDTVGIGFRIGDSTGSQISGATVFLSVLDSEGKEVASLQGLTDENGEAVFKWKTSNKQGAGAYTVDVTDVVMDGYVYNAEERDELDKVKFNIQ
ncbi:Ig-like domain-containing protein [Methanosarcina sp. 1.H.A.2.2]|uniref:Ig-like domain-containing protein n=1 Tax=Methanosarcina sp. 1.H.A.2.2 TaxID=1483601 RepID=UPI0012E02513|nr:Ig-like domain-containing protein [Methanosarcina sp. 1.H.A.2.2]